MTLASFRLSPAGEDPFGWFESSCQCGACQGFQAEEILDVAESAATLSAIYQVSRAEQVEPPATAESGGEDFLPEELALLALLLSVVTPKFESFRAEAVNILETATRPEDDLFNLVNRVSPDMEHVFDDIELDVRKNVFSTISEGEAKVAASSLQKLISTQQVGEGIVRATGYYTNKFFNTQIVPEIQRQIDLLLDDPYSNLNRPNFKPLIDILNRRLRTVPYWRVVANAAASRGFHYGYIKALSINQVAGYKLVAVIDNKTSDICRELNGKTFWVKDAVDHLERIYAGNDPEAAKQLSPWLPYKKITGLSANELRALGVLVPPFHGNCRTTIKPVYGTADVPG